MSALPRHTADMGYAGLRLSAAQYRRLGETTDRYELVDGVVLVSPSPSRSHQRLIRELLRQFTSYLDANPGAEVLADIDVEFSAQIIYRPDLVLYRPGRLTPEVEYLTTPPDLAIEVLSPSSKPLDLITKREDYERFDVGEYWVIDPSTASIRAWQRPEPGQPFVEADIPRGRLASTAVPGFVLDLEALRLRG